MTAPCLPLPLAEVLPGMILSDVLRDAKGNVLLAEGVVLTETMLASLARHGIVTLPIVQHAATPAPLDPAAVQARLDHLFRTQDPADESDWASAALRHHLEDYRLRRGAGAAA
jgi:hypothetical protein